jgi:hypothetical protein
VFTVLIGLALVVFAVAIVTNVNVPKVPNWLAIVVWSTFGVMVACCLGVVITLMLEYREKKEPDEDELADDEPVAEEGELAAVGAPTEMDAGEGIVDAGAEPGEESHFGGEHESSEFESHEEAHFEANEPAGEHEPAAHSEELPDLDVNFEEE